MIEKHHFILIIRNLIIILPTNLIIILIKSKFKMAKMDAVGISYYHKNLTRGQKDIFVRRVAEAIDKATSSVYRKVSSGKWTALEIAAIEKVIEEMDN